MILSRDDIDSRADAILRDFGGKSPLDVFSLASDYLGLELRSLWLSDEGSILGITTYTEVDVRISSWGYGQIAHFTASTLAIDSRLYNAARREYKERGRLRFTIAHECAHQILFRMEPDARQSSLRRLDDRPYSARELKSRDDWSEWQANALAAALLMPSAAVRKIQRLPLTRYGRRINRPDDLALYRLMSEFGVSRAAMLIRLRELGLLEERPAAEYYDPTEIWNYEADEVNDAAPA
ncbi:MAG: ImmA/IrrE family metallo-endopeptidase [Oscillospiraceae bacterium]|jgi:Zn-dependent peptidase ImmA (M78 family)|nr:ImmA/IrrE family metallo-endopeptidase [Oscillospiraceae bacterium]